jgi:hypothetical protein
MNIFIKKVNLSDFADNRYWGNFGKLTELSFDTYQMLKLIDFYQAAESYKTAVLEKLDVSIGFYFKFFSSTDTPTVAYLMYGLVNASDYLEVLNHGDKYSLYVSVRDILFSELGWEIVDERVSVIESQFNKTTLEWSNVPSNIAEVAALYDNSIDISNFLENNV